MSLLPADTESDPRAVPGDRTRAWVVIHLTPFAPDCEQREVKDPRRWIKFRAATPELAIGQMLIRLQLTPDQVAPATSRAGDEVEIFAETAEGPQPVAIVSRGLDLADVVTALAALKARLERDPSLERACRL